MFNMFSNSIDYDILVQCKMRFEKSLKFYSKNQWLWCKKQIWFDKENAIHSQISKLEHA